MRRATVHGQRHPSTTPLSEWSRGWLVMETARLLGNPSYILMYDSEREKAGLPATDEQMRTLIQQHRECK